MAFGFLSFPKPAASSSALSAHPQPIGFLARHGEQVLPTPFEQTKLPLIVEYFTLKYPDRSPPNITTLTVMVRDLAEQKGLLVPQFFDKLLKQPDNTKALWAVIEELDKRLYAPTVDARGTISR